MKDAGRLVGFGVGLGLLGSVGAAILAKKLLFGTAAWDVETLVVLGAAAMVASWLPARRAAGVNPVDALRAE